MSDSPIQNDFSWKVRFSPDGDGLKRDFIWAKNEPEEGEHDLSISIRVAATKDHGLVTMPIRLPRYLMPQWSPDDWASFFNSQMGWIHDTIEENLVQCLSLAIACDSKRRTAVLDEAEQVLIDFRGDLPNLYLPLQYGGYKVGVYRRNNNWPIWLSIQPTYDLALEEGKKIRDEAKIAKSNSAIVAVGKLAISVDPDFIKRFGLGLIQSSKVNDGYLWVVLQSLAAGVVIGWWLKVGLAWVSN